MTIVAAADGSSLGNPGPSGWAWVIDDERWASGGFTKATNNIGELTAVIDLLRQTAGTSDDLRVLCDSKYVIQAATEWLPGWKRRGWKKADGKPVLNADLMRELDALLAGRSVQFEWVKGHAGHALNERADALAQAAARAFQSGGSAEPGPGFTNERANHETSNTQATSDALDVPNELPDEPDLFAGLFDLETGEADETSVVARLQEQLYTDALREDVALAASLLASTLVSVDADGHTRTRDEVLDTLAPLTEAVSVTVREARAIGADSVLLLWETSGARPCVHSSLWQREHGQWRLAYTQATAAA